MHLQHIHAHTHIIFMIYVHVRSASLWHGNNRSTLSSACCNLLPVSRPVSIPPDPMHTYIYLYQPAGCSLELSTIKCRNCQIKYKIWIERKLFRCLSNIWQTDACQDRHKKYNSLTIEYIWYVYKLNIYALNILPCKYSLKIKCFIFINNILFTYR